MSLSIGARTTTFDGIPIQRTLPKGDDWYGAAAAFQVTNSIEGVLKSQNRAAIVLLENSQIPLVCNELRQRAVAAQRQLLQVTDEVVLPYGPDEWRKPHVRINESLDRADSETTIVVQHYPFGKRNANPGTNRNVAHLSKADMEKEKSLQGTVRKTQIDTKCRVLVLCSAFPDPKIFDREELWWYNTPFRFPYTVHRVELAPQPRVTPYVSEQPNVDNLWNPTFWVTA